MHRLLFLLVRIAAIHIQEIIDKTKEKKTFAPPFDCRDTRDTLWDYSLFSFIYATTKFDSWLTHLRYVSRSAIQFQSHLQVPFFCHEFNVSDSQLSAYF